MYAKPIGMYISYKCESGVVQESESMMDHFWDNIPLRN